MSCRGTFGLAVVGLTLLAGACAEDSAHGAVEGACLVPRPPAWRIIVLPDTQTDVSLHPERLAKQVEWIVRERERLDVRFVAHVGDVVEVDDSSEQWRTAERELAGLRDVVPLALTVGNHDLASNGAYRESLMDDYFAWDDLGPASSQGPRYDDKVWNSARFVEGNRGQWLLLTLEFGPRNAVVDWAATVLGEHPAMPAIVVTHADVFVGPDRFDWALLGNSQPQNPHSYGLWDDRSRTTHSINDGQELWDKLISVHSNVRVVVSGHSRHEGVGRITTERADGSFVHEVVGNYQDQVVYRGQPMGGSGYLRILVIDEDAGRLDVCTYSPWLETSLRRTDQEFTLSL